MENKAHALPGGAKFYRVSTVTQARLLSEHADRFGGAKNLIPAAPTKTPKPATPAAQESAEQRMIAQFRLLSPAQRLEMVGRMSKVRSERKKGGGKKVARKLDVAGQ